MLTHYTAILCSLALCCAACGVSGPLTVRPKPVKDLDGLATPTPVENRSATSASVLYSADGKQTTIFAPALAPAN